MINGIKVLRDLISHEFTEMGGAEVGLTYCRVEIEFVIGRRGAVHVANIHLMRYPSSKPP